jgi:sugar phosphate isomerase/epimerase
MISFSTCWNSERHTVAEAMLREIKTKLGFDLIELDHDVRTSMMPGIQKIFNTREIRFSSLHNFCPAPVETPAASADSYKFSGASAEERETAVMQTFRTIDFAAQLNASVVVLHLGQTSMPPITHRLIAMAKAGEYLSRDYVKMKIKAVQERERIGPEYLERVKNCLRRIVEYATPKNVKVGLEGRRNYEQIPTERELAELLEEMNSPHLGYWHDFGHSQIKENLGFIDHAEWLRTIGSRAFGCHVHDCIWPARDHRPPFTAGVDFERLVPLLPTNCLFVWEMNPNETADVIRQSVQMWKERFGE